MKGSGEELVGRPSSPSTSTKATHQDCFDAAMSAVRYQQFAEAQIWFRRAIQLRPDDVDSQNNLANVLWQQGRLAEAEVHYRLALQLQPGNAAFQNNLGNLLWSQGKIEESETRYRAALQLDPGLVEAKVNLGVALRF